MQRKGRRVLPNSDRQLADRCFKLQMGLSMRVMQQLLQRISTAENLQVGIDLELPPGSVAADDEHAHINRISEFKISYDSLPP